jgi:hypothetical protein
MEWHFGYNCKHYLPTLNKCRILIDSYRERKDLIELKWLNLKDVLAYLNLSNAELFRRITIKEIKAKLQKDEKIIFQVSCAWQWDDCPLGQAGGQCLYFEPHTGRKISFLAELRNIKKEDHPNNKTITDKEIEILESQITQAIGGNSNIDLTN